MRLALCCVLLLAAAPPAAAPSPTRPALTPVAPRAAQDSVASWMRPGVSLALAQHRARTVADVRYDLTLDVSALDHATGTVRITFTRTGPGDVILDFRGQALSSASANGTPLPGEASNGAHVRVAERLLRDGTNTLDLAFAAAIAPSGASIIRFHDATDGADYLYTLLVPADANQLFPCFDQPDLKARVTLTLTTPAGWTALANGALRRADTLNVPYSDATDSSVPRAVAASRVTFRFGETPPISTYLIAFAAGPWRSVSATVDVPGPGGGPPERRAVTGYVRRSRAAEADLDTLVALNARALGWMQGYFATAYPFPKFEFLLAPAFPFGGMEHPGAIFYNEDRFIFRERPTLPRRLGRFSTVLHEVAHQWFGDLVTMRWFDDLWLKEGFATYMAAKALDDLEPASGAWKTFYLANKPAAYGVDETAGTTPLWQELANLDQAKSNYGAIVYNKAPAVLKQLSYLVGEDAFRGGVRALLRDHAFGNFTWRDLLGAVGEAAHRDLDGFGRAFVLRPGMPEVTQEVEARGGRVVRLALTQRPADTLSGPGPWPMRTQVLLAYDGRPAVVLPVELRGAVTDVAAARGLGAPVFVFANAGDYGYFLTLLDAPSLRALEGGALGRVEDPFLRAMLWGALWDQVRAARLAPSAFVTLALRELPAERDEQILPGILARLGRAIAAYSSPAARDTLRPRAESVLWAGAADPARPYGVRKAFLDAFVALAATPDGVGKLVGLLRADSAAGEPARDPLRWDVVTRLRVLAAPDAEALADAQARRDTTPDGRRRAFAAVAARRDPATKAAYFERYFADTTLNEDWATASLGGFNALEHQALTLPYLGPALDSLPFIQAHRRIFFLGSWLGAFLGGQANEEALSVVRGYLGAHPDLPRDLRQKVLQSADELERTVRIRARWD